MPRLIGSAQAVTNQAEQITTFNSSGTLTTGALTTELQYVVVAGGGGAGTNTNGSGGGGAGGYRSSVPGESSGGGASAESTTPVSGGSPYPITVGAGGAGGAAGAVKVGITEIGRGR